jgi:hypothetical protein
VNIYAQAADWLEENPDRWIKGDYFRDSQGQVLEDVPNYPEALDGDVCFCLSGLLHALSGEEVYCALEERFHEALGAPHESLPAYNDHEDTELDDIIRRLRNAARIYNA